jgi:hypothetical protein
MSKRFAVIVEGIESPELVAEIEQTIHASLQELSLPGSWRIAVRPSPVGGRWDFTVHGLDVRHTLSIAVPPSLLPTLIPSRLQESLNRLSHVRIEEARTRTLSLAV